MKIYQRIGLLLFISGSFLYFNKESYHIIYTIIITIGGIMYVWSEK